MPATFAGCVGDEPGYQVIRRNDAVSPFDATKISVVGRFHRGECRALHDLKANFFETPVIEYRNGGALNWEQRWTGAPDRLDGVRLPRLSE